MSDQVKARPPLSPRDVAEAIGMSVDFVYLEIEQGELTASRFGRQYRIAFVEVVRYFEEKRFPMPDGWKV
jgi:excisionase family DNA binding protein